MAGGIGWADGGVGWKDGGLGWGPGHNPVKPQESEEPNPFRDADTVTELLGMLVGAGSTCWVGGTGHLEFDSTAATKVVDDGIKRLIELGWAK
jgi:hypothetical protein